MEVSDVLQWGEENFKSALAMEWDNCGLLIGNKNSKVTKILLSLDVTKEVIFEALEKGAELILTHHPIIFHPLKNVTENSLVMELIKNNLNVISYHTNLDISPGGVNDQLAKKLGLKDIKKFMVNATGDALMRVGQIEKITSSTFLKQVKTALKCPVLRTSGVEREIRTVAVCGGSGGGFLEDVAENNIDAFVTGDVHFDRFHYAREKGVLLIDGGHFETETLVLPFLKGLLEKEFIDIQVMIGEENKNPITYY